MKRIPLAIISGVLLAACVDNTPTEPTRRVASGLSANGTRSTATYDFFNCVGPTGTPTSFTAEKTALPTAASAPVSAAGAFQFTDGSAVFVVLSFSTGFPPGIDLAASATTTCSVTIGGTVYQWSGHIAWTP